MRSSSKKIIRKSEKTGDCDENDENNDEWDVLREEISVTDE